MVLELYKGYIMSSRDKLVQKLKNCGTDSRPEEIHALLVYYGFQYCQPGTSHRTYFHQDLSYILTIPWKRPIKKVYIQKVLEAIELLEELQGRTK